MHRLKRLRHAKMIGNVTGHEAPKHGRSAPKSSCPQGKVPSWETLQETLSETGDKCSGRHAPVVGALEDPAAFPRDRAYGMYPARRSSDQYQSFVPLQPSMGLSAAPTTLNFPYKKVVVKHTPRSPYQ